MLYVALDIGVYAVITCKLVFISFELMCSGESKPTDISENRSADIGGFYIGNLMTQLMSYVFRL